MRRWPMLLTFVSTAITTQKDFETAKKLEAKMKDEGFDTGKQLGNGQEDSKFVYVYKKINGVTNESL